MYSRGEALRILKEHCAGITEFRFFIKHVGIKKEYSEQELKDFLGY